MRLTNFGVLAALSLMLAGVNPLPAQVQRPQPPQNARFLVLVDAAHGGDDAGAKLGNGMPEKSWTLAYAQRLRSLLAARGMQVSLTRSTDLNLAPNERAGMANHMQPLACIIVHATESGSGIHLFVSSLSPQQSAKLMPWRTIQAAEVPRSIALAGQINSALTHAGVPVSMTRTSLAVVDSMACPAVAIELAPLNAAGKQSAAALDDKDYLARSAEAIAAALVAWRAEVR